MDDTARAHLLTVPGMQKVPTPRLDLFVLRGFLDPALCESLIDQIEANQSGDEIGRPGHPANAPARHAVALRHRVDDQSIEIVHN